jgi:hypothetical protein
MLELQDGVMMYELRLRCHALARAATMDEQESVGCVLTQTETAHLGTSLITRAERASGQPSVKRSVKTICYTTDDELDSGRRFGTRGKMLTTSMYTCFNIRANRK